MRVAEQAECTLRYSNHGRHINSLERTANSAPFMREAWMSPQLCARALNSGVMLLACFSTTCNHLAFGG